MNYSSKCAYLNNYRYCIFHCLVITEISADSIKTDIKQPYKFFYKAHIFWSFLTIQTNLIWNPTFIGVARNGVCVVLKCFAFETCFLVDPKCTINSIKITLTISQRIWGLENCVLRKIFLNEDEETKCSMFSKTCNDTTAC